MKLYHYDKETGEFTGISTALVAPGRENLPNSEKKKWVIPANSTTTPVQYPFTEGKMPVWDGNAWTEQDDHRGKKRYKKDKSDEDEIRSILDDVDTEWTLKPPPEGEYWYWNDKADDWVEDEDKKAERKVKENRREIIQKDIHKKNFDSLAESDPDTIDNVINNANDQELRNIIKGIVKDRAAYR